MHFVINWAPVVIQGRQSLQTDFNLFATTRHTCLFLPAIFCFNKIWWYRYRCVNILFLHHKYANYLKMLVKPGRNCIHIFKNYISYYFFKRNIIHTVTEWRILTKYKPDYLQRSNKNSILSKSSFFQFISQCH